MSSQRSFLGSNKSIHKAHEWQSPHAHLVTVIVKLNESRCPALALLFALFHSCLDANGQLRGYLETRWSQIYLYSSRHARPSMITNVTYTPKWQQSWRTCLMPTASFWVTCLILPGTRVVKLWRFALTILFGDVVSIAQELWNNHKAVESLLWLDSVGPSATRVWLQSRNGWC